ncbi:MAG: metal-dependent hydrolase [Thermomicrobiales bacterium]
MLVALRIMTGDQPELVLHGAFDELGHLLTALLIAIGLKGRRPHVYFYAILLGGVILDLGHISDILGLTEPIADSSRNGTHSLVVVALIAALALLDRRRAPLWLGVAVGALTHLWRDLGTGYVALAWPLSDRVWGVSFGWYIGVLVTLGLAFVVLPRRPPIVDIV